MKYYYFLHCQTGENIDDNVNNKFIYEIELNKLPTNCILLDEYDLIINIKD